MESTRERTGYSRPAGGISVQVTQGQGLHAACDGAWKLERGEMDKGER